MKIGYVQNSPIFGEKDTNFKQVEDLLHGVSADLIVLPELFATGYTFTSQAEALALSETTEGETAHFLKRMSKKTGAVIVAGFAQRGDKGVYNSSMMVYLDHVIGVYQKIHLFNKEKFWFLPGELPLEVHEIKQMKIGMMVCFDWLFPEVSRALALKGAQIIAHPSNLVLPYCQTAMVTRCLENRVFVVTANRIGREQRGNDDLTFTGKSQVTATNGKILASAPTDGVSVAFVEIDPAAADEKMITPYNHVLTDRRPEFY